MLSYQLGLSRTFSRSDMTRLPRIGRMSASLLKNGHLRQPDVTLCATLAECNYAMFKSAQIGHTSQEPVHSFKLYKLLPSFLSRRHELALARWHTSSTHTKETRGSTFGGMRHTSGTTDSNVIEGRRHIIPRITPVSSRPYVEATKGWKGVQRLRGEGHAPVHRADPLVDLPLKRAGNMGTLE